MTLKSSQEPHRGHGNPSSTDVTIDFRRETIELVSEILVSNPDGIHIRPAHTLTMFAIEVKKFTGVTTLISDVEEKRPWQDIVEEHELAVAGFGIWYHPFTSMRLEVNSRYKVKFWCETEGSPLREVLDLFEKLNFDSEILELGGYHERFQQDYLIPIGALAQKHSGLKALNNVQQ